jgi:hypothetical protein
MPLLSLKLSPQMTLHTAKTFKTVFRGVHFYPACLPVGRFKAAKNIFA